MDDRDNRVPAREDRAERLAAALRANLKRRKVQARGRHDRAEVAGEGENRPNHPDGEDG